MTPSNVPQRPELIRLPMAYWQGMENAPVMYEGKPLLVLNYRDDSRGWHDHYADSMYLYIIDLQNGKRIAEFGQGHSCVKAFVDGKRLHVYASEATNYEYFQSMYDFWTDDLKTWHRQLAVKREEGEHHMFNPSVCRDDQGFVMAYVAYAKCGDPASFPYFKFARSKDLVHWEKIPDLAFAGPSGKQYSNTPAIRYFAPWYYVIFYTTVDETGRMAETSSRYVSLVARSKDLVRWQLSPLNPVLEPVEGDGISTSDVEPLEFEGNTYLFYGASNQIGGPEGWSAARVAMYRGGLKTFFESWFPEGMDMQEVLTRQS